MVDSGTPFVDVVETDEVVTVRMNRSEKLNALGPELVMGLYTALSDLQYDDRGILLTGAGRATCAGMDTDIVGDGDYPEAYPDLHEQLRAAQQLLIDRTAPSAMAGFGVLVGAGFSFSLRCDFLILGEETTCSLPEIRYDIPVFENARLVADLVGPRIAKEIALTGRRLDPDRLHEVGLANEVVADAEVEGTAYDLLDEIAGHDSSHIAEVLQRL